MPLVYQAFNWIHGVYIGATMGSETTAAAAGGGQVRRDPMAMLPFCGYNMGDYFRHWVAMRKLIKFPPRIFHVNWFRKDARELSLARVRGKHARVEMDRGPLHGRANAIETPLGWVPYAKDFDLNGLANYSPEIFDRVQTINYDDWRRELLQQDELFMKIYSHLPKELIFQRELLVARL